VEDNLAALRILAEENTVQDQAVEAAVQTVQPDHPKLRRFPFRASQRVGQSCVGIRNSP
jgi:hypothetical protein